MYIVYLDGLGQQRYWIDLMVVVLYMGEIYTNKYDCNMDVQVSNWFANIKFPQTHKSISYKHEGLIATQRIAPKTILFQIASQNIITHSTLPSAIKQLQSIDTETQLTLYIMILKIIGRKAANGEDRGCWEGEGYEGCEGIMEATGKGDDQGDREGISSRMREWIGKNTHGFIGFQESVIKASGDQRLILEFLAYKQHYKQQSNTLFNKHQVRSLVQAIYPNISVSQFSKLWIQSSQFKNTRCFGYTSQSLLIPVMDYLNFNPASSQQKVHFISYNTPQQIIPYFQQYSQPHHNHHLHPFPPEQIDSDDEQQQRVQKSQGTLGQVGKYVGLLCVQSIERDEQIYFHYGALPNYQLLKSYGFATSNNRFDYVTIYLSDYWREKVIYFSPVERSTTKFHIFQHWVNQNFIQHWMKIMGVRDSRQLRGQALNLLINTMSANSPPHNLLLLSPRFPPQAGDISRRGYRFLRLHQEQQLRIYRCQIERIGKYRQKILGNGQMLEDNRKNIIDSII